MFYDLALSKVPRVKEVLLKFIDENCIMCIDAVMSIPS